DTETREGGHQVLDRRNARTIHHEHGAERRLAHVLCERRNVDRGLEIDTAKDDAVIGWCGTHCHQHFGAGVQSHARRADRVLESSLTNHTRSEAVAPGPVQETGW